MEILIKKLEENSFNTFAIKDEPALQITPVIKFNQIQKGYRTTGKKIIKNWKEIVGNNFYVIGFTTALGDPILADTNNKNLPIYYIFNENWENIPKVANSFDEFISNLKHLDKMINIDNCDRSTIRKFARRLDKKYNTLDFYRVLCFDVIDKDGLYYKDFKAYNK